MNDKQWQELINKYGIEVAGQILINQFTESCPRSEETGELPKEVQDEH